MVNILFISGLILLSATTSYAGTWEIITHGGYDAAVSAWNKIALIFSDNNYTALFLSVAVLGAIILYLSVYTRIALGSKGNPLSGWGVPFMIGIVLYMGFIVPKDRIIIYDETLNRGPQAIDNIPRGVATIAGLLNKIEKGFTNIIWTSSDPSTDYRIQAGGAGFNALGATSAGLYNLPYSFTSTFENFIKDCVFVEMQRPGTSLDINKIQSGQQDYLTVITESANPAFYTTSYLNKTEGEPLTCSDAAQQIARWLNNQNNVKPAIKAACAVAGYDPNIPQSLNACINATDNLIGKLTENQITSTLSGFAQQAIFAQVTANVTTSINPSLAIKALATSQSMSSFIGMGAHANSWIPVIKETLSAIAVGLVPLFAIVCVTPLVGKAFSIMAGMFVWLSVWGIVDSIIHSFAMEFAYKSAESLKISGGASGLASMLMFPGYTVKVGALFGAIRWFGLMLSSIITAMFLRFGGTAMAMLAGSLSGTVQAAGASYGVSMLKNPSSVFSSEVMPAVGIHNAAVTVGGINNLAQGLGKHQGGSMAGQAMVGSKYGAGGIAESGFLSGVESTERGLSLGTSERAEMVGRVAGGTAVGGAVATKMMAEAMGYTGSDADKAAQLATFRGRGNVLNKTEAENLNLKLFGKTDGAFESGMKLDFGMSGDGQYYYKGITSDGTKLVEVAGNKQITTMRATNVDLGGGYKGLAGDLIMEKDITTGATTTRYSGIIADKNGKTYQGTLTKDPEGNMVLVDGESGRKFESKDYTENQNWSGNYSGIDFKHAIFTQKGDNINISGTNADATLLRQIARKARALGDTKAAVQIEKIAQGLKPGESASYKITGDSRGNIAGIEVVRESTGQKVDMGVYKKTQQTRVGDDTRIGNETTKGDRDTDLNWQGTFDGIEFVRAEKTVQGDLVFIRGIGKDGNYYTIVGRQYKDANGRLIQETISKDIDVGPNYDGSALAMVLSGKMPALKTDPEKYKFTAAFTSEVHNIFSRKVRNTTGIQGDLGVGSGGVGIGIMASGVGISDYNQLFYEVKDIVDRVGTNPNLTSQELKKWFDKKMEEVEKQVAPVKGNLLEQQIDKFGEFKPYGPT